MEIRRGSILDFFFENSLFLILGTGVGLAWANIHADSYQHLLHFKIWENDWIGYAQEGGRRVVDLHFLVNDILMALFFALAGKEVWEAMLPGGHMSDLRRAATPIIAAVGGMVGPASVYLAGATMIGRLPEYGHGWAIPCATDIAFSFLVARMIFGRRHPAVAFLLLLAIADDAMGLLILAVFYPQGEVRLVWLLLALAAVIVGLAFRRMRLPNFWWYLLIPGSISWLGFAFAGLHPALGLLPIVPVMPHEHVGKNLFNWDRLGVKNTLMQFEEWWRHPVEVILGLFGLLNAGVQFGALGAPTYLVLVGLLVGKPIGIWISGVMAARVFRLGLPEGVEGRQLFVIGCVAAIGFTVALFVATVAFPPGSTQDAAKMGALASFLAAIMAFAAAKILGVSRAVETEGAE